MHEKLNQLAPEDERACLRRAIEAIVKATGGRPRGFRAPSWAFSPHTLDLLVDEGFDYDASLAGHDIPYLVANGKGSLVELPADINQSAFSSGRQPRRPEAGRAEPG